MSNPSTMQDEEPEKLDLSSMDIAALKRRELKQLFPEAFTETREDDGTIIEAVDFEKLKSALGEFSDVLERQRERYGMLWPGKNECQLIIQKPSQATLKPDREGSVNFDNTKNLFIEGDNLEVLKLLQKSYYGKVKMIYVDPPYNTGKDFVYPDDYSETLDTYMRYAGLAGEDGKKWESKVNSKDSGRFHTRWLNMMYPRLYLARNLLREDGVIFISIDNNEVSNLQKICDDIFGEENFIGNLVLQTATDNNKTQINTEHEYILVYGKNAEDQPYWTRRSEAADRIQEKYEQLKDTYEDDIEAVQSELRSWIRSNKDQLPKVTHYDNVDDKGVFHDGDIANTKFGGYKYSIPHPATGKECKIPEKGFRFPEATMKEMIENGDIMFGSDHTTLIKPKKRLKDAKDALRSIIYEDGRGSTKVVEKLLGRDVFKNPKSHFTLGRIIEFTTGDNDLILDFFAGSGSTMHASIEAKVRDSKNRRFILVQLPEPISDSDSDSERAFEFCESINKPTNISEICKERLRRTGKLTLEEYPDFDGDLGFKVFKLDRSNFKVWDSEPKDDTEAVKEQIELHIDHIDPKASQEDILYELLLKAGFPLTTKIEKHHMENKDVFAIEDGALLICLEKSLTPELIRAMADASPLQVICLDEGFEGNDQLKTNAVQTFKSRAQGDSEHQQIVFRTV